MYEKISFQFAFVAGLAALYACGASAEGGALEGDPGFEELTEEGIVADELSAEGDEALAGEVEGAEGAVELGVAEQGLGNLCKNVRIRVTNLREEPDGSSPDIKVTALEYFNDARNKYVREGVTNRIIHFGDTYPFVESLENADGDVLTQWRVYYKYDLGSGWSSETHEHINTANVACSDGMNVDLTVQY